VTTDDPPDRGEMSHTVFYDGGCGLCHRVVRFIVLRDHERRFRFAPLGGEAFREQLPEATRETLPDSLVLLTDRGQILLRSAGTRFALDELGGPWRWLARASRLVPLAVADRLYDLVASSRHRMFGRPQESCPLLPPELGERFLD
jgi:predicted DCC family thiol-disulfide oxidoreductase YuxK